MKMQEVIVRLRELAPEAAQNVDLAIKDFYVMKDLLSDLQACVSSSTREAVLKLISERSRGLSEYLDAAQNATSRLQELNESYKEKLGPRTKKSKDAEGQQMLPGMEGVVMEESSDMSVRATTCRTPSWITSGRHG